MRRQITYYATVIIGTLAAFLIGMGVSLSRLIGVPQMCSRKFPTRGGVVSSSHRGTPTTKSVGRMAVGQIFRTYRAYASHAIGAGMKDSWRSPARSPIANLNRVPREFPFNESPTLGVYATQEILDLQAPILLVLHDRDGDWQFLPGSDPGLADGVVLHLAHIVERFPNIHELADLARGWGAERSAAGAPWDRFSIDEEPLVE